MASHTYVNQWRHRCANVAQIVTFLVKDSRLYERLCPSVHPSAGNARIGKYLSSAHAPHFSFAAILSPRVTYSFISISRYFVFGKSIHLPSLFVSFILRALASFANPCEDQSCSRRGSSAEEVIAACSACHPDELKKKNTNEWIFGSDTQLWKRLNPFVGPSVHW